MAKMNPWVPISDPKLLRRLGKMAEELAELQAVVARCIIQGVDGIDPASGRTNRENLFREIADVGAQVALTVELFGLDLDAIEVRAMEKTRQMAEWEAFFNQEGA